MASPAEHRNTLAEVKASSQGDDLVILTVRSWLSSHTLYSVHMR